MNDDRPRQPARNNRRRDAEPRPLDAEKLQALALHYAARYATTAANVQRYLNRKVRERGWAGDAPPAVDTLTDRLVALGYVDDRSFSAARSRSLGARGFGARRVAATLAAAGVGEDDRADALADAQDNALATAIAFARRRRFGPFAPDPVQAADPARRAKAFAAMLRAGHAMDVTKRVLAARSEDELTAEL